MDGGGSSNAATGLQINDHYIAPDVCYPYSSVELGDDCDWREGITIADNYIHDTVGACAYLGPNYTSRNGDASGPSYGADEWKLRNIRFSRNYVSDCGSDGVKLKSNWGSASESVIDHNYIVRLGKAKRPTSEGATDHCILVFEGNGTVHSNYCEDNLATVNERAMILAYNQATPATLGSFDVAIYNNVLHRASGACISVGRLGTDIANVVASVYSNTLVGCGSQGVVFQSNVQGGLARDNLVADAREAVDGPSSVAIENNLGGAESPVSLGIKGSPERDFRISASSPARDAGTRFGPALDFDGRSRPKGDGFDVGAFEFSGDANLTGTRKEPGAPLVVDIL